MRAAERINDTLGRAATTGKSPSMRHSMAKAPRSRSCCAALAILPALVGGAPFPDCPGSSTGCTGTAWSRHEAARQLAAQDADFALEARDT